MAPIQRPSSPLLFTAVLLLSSAASATPVFNITRLIGQHPEFAAFNAYLSKTNLSGDINSRRTITVLAFDDAAAAALAGKPLSVVKDVLSFHVILDFLGLPKLRHIVLEERRSVFLATLLQASGRGAGQQGFVNISASSAGGVAFHSAAGGAAAELLGSVAVRPYDISVLKVSAAIFPPGVDPNPSPPPPQPAPVAADPPEEAEAPSDEVESVPPAPEPDSPAPVGDAPASSPPELGFSDAGDADALAPESENSGSVRVTVGFLMMVIGLVSFFVAF